jgi:negative regulator of sigma E activity
MNDDYLWDKSGEPDPQIQQIEEILGTLRYQPKPLQLPKELATSHRRRNYLPWLAIAATVVMALSTGFAWFQFRSQDASIPTVAIATPATPIIGPPLSRVSFPSTESPKKRTPRLVKYNQQEALAAKQQLMFALRLASEKLNAVQRRTQDRRSSYENTLPN